MIKTILLLLLVYSINSFAFPDAESQKQAYIQQGLQQAGNAQAAMSMFYNKHHYWPETHAAAGLPDPKAFATEAVSHIGIARTGPTATDMAVIVIQFNEAVEHALVMLEGQPDDKGIQWICKGSLETRYLPEYCQESVMDDAEMQTVQIKKPAQEINAATKINYINESIRLSRSVRRAMLEYYYTHHEWPEDNLAAGLATPDKIQYGVIAALTVSRTGGHYDDQGIITIKYNDILDSHTLILETRLLSDTSIRWSCRDRGTLPVEFRPEICQP